MFNKHIPSLIVNKPPTINQCMSSVIDLVLLHQHWLINWRVIDRLKLINVQIGNLVDNMWSYRVSCGPNMINLGTRRKRRRRRRRTFMQSKITNHVDVTTFNIFEFCVPPLPFILLLLVASMDSLHCFCFLSSPSFIESFP
jgi:hypothetical protein